MAKKPIDNKASERLKGIDLTQPKSQPSIKELVMEGDQLLLASEKVAAPQATPPKTAAPASNPTNPYVRARVKVLADMHGTFRNEILQCEKDKNVDHRFYLEFVQKVAALGDQYSDE